MKLTVGVDERAAALAGASSTEESSRARRARVGWRSAMAVACASLVTLAAADGAAAASFSSGIDRGSRITVATSDNAGVTATARHGDTLYVGGNVRQFALRAEGLAAFDTDDATLQTDVAELDGADSSTLATAAKVVPDGDGGTYVVGVTGRGAAGVRQSGVLHITSAGAVDAGFRPRFRDDDGETTTDVRDLAVGADGTVYVAGAFAQVGGGDRAGLAALDPATGAPRAWDPALANGGDAVVVDKIALADGQLLLAGSFETIDGQARAGLGGVALADAAPTTWAPAGLDAADAAVALLAAGANAQLVSDTAVNSVTTGGQGTVRNLNLAPNGSILAAALGGANSLFLTGDFSRVAGVDRARVAEVALSSGTTTSWTPPAAMTGFFGAGPAAVAVDASKVYVAMPRSGDPTNWSGSFRCGAAALDRATGAVTAWQPRVQSGFHDCAASPASLAVSGSRVWAAGDFVEANAVDRVGFGAIDVSEDEILPWAPVTDSPQVTVPDMEVSPDGETVYIAGGFVTMNGEFRLGAAAVSGTSAGTADDAADVRAWDPAPGPFIGVNALELRIAPDRTTVQSVFLGGLLTDIGSESGYSNLAEVNATTGAPVTTFKPVLNDIVNELSYSAGDGSAADPETLYAGGAFTSVGATPVTRRGLAAFAPGSETPTSWDPQLAGEAGGSVLDLALGDGVVYAAGTFNGTIGGQTRTGVAALRRADGTAVATWDARANGPVATVSTLDDGTVVLVGGDGGSAIGFTRLDGRARPASLGAIAADGTVTRWAPQATRFRHTPFMSANDVREVAGKLVLPGRVVPPAAVDGVAQDGLLTFAGAAAPVSTVPPTIAGTPREGQTLTCVAGDYGLEVVSTSYQWLRNGDPIEDATGSTYLVQADDRGADLACRETAENTAGTVAVTSADVRVAALRPTNVELPDVSGTVRVGVRATCARGRWSDYPTEYRYQWRLDGAPIASATAQTYTPIDGQAGKGLSCAVVAVNAAGETSATSAARTIAAGERPTCEQTGSCPRPTCEQTGTCPRPTCEQTNSCPPPPCQVNCNPTPPGRTTPPSNAFSILRKTTSASAITFTLKAPGAGSFRAAATARSGKRTLNVASARAAAKAGGNVVVRLTLSSAAKRALAKQRTLRVAVSITFTPTGGSARTVTQTVVVRAARRAARRSGRKKPRR